MARQNRYGETLMNQLDLQGRHAVITGGATGLGFAIASRMLASGARVTLWDRDARGLSAAVKNLQGSASASHAGGMVSGVTVHIA